MNSISKNGSDLLNSIITESWENKIFKKELIKNPKSVIEDFTQIKLSDKKEIVVEDQTDSNTIFINIPQKIDLDSLELSEEELEMVSGGSTPVCGTIALAVGGYLLGHYVL